MKWIFDAISPDRTTEGGSAFDTLLESALGAGNASGRKISEYFVRETIANCADQRRTDNTHPVDIFIDFIALSGDEKIAFKKEMNWQSLEEHLKAAMPEDQSNPIYQSFKRAISRINNDERPITLVKVSDFNAIGLEGKEWDDEDKNFHLFAKSLFKTSSDTSRQGSFGLGKGVFYHLSSINTVLMSSYCNIGGANKMRLYGRSELPTHKSSEGLEDRKGEIRCKGRGYFGLTHETERGNTAVSSSDETQQTIKNLFLDRDLEMGTGTSIISVDFNLEGSIDNTMAHFERDIMKWFWPALCSEKKEINITIRRFNGHEHLAEQDKVVKLDAKYKPFSMAMRDDPNSKDLNTVGNIASEQIKFALPAKTIEPSNQSWDDGKAFNANGMLKIYRHDSSYDENTGQQNKIALLRNNLCVVEYIGMSELPDISSSNFYGVFKAGRALGDSKEDEKFHDFLRSAEPPLHNNWKYRPKVGAIYNFTENPTAHSFLTGLYSSIQNAAINLTDIRDKQDNENLDHLAKLFNFGGAGSGENMRLISDKVLSKELDGRKVSVTVRVNNLQETPAEWKVETSLSLMAINNSENNLILDSIDFDKNEGINLDDINAESDGRSAIITASSSIKSFIFTINALQPEVVDTESAYRQKYKISVISRT